MTRTGGREFTGRFRGTVVNNVDPENLGRLLVTVPDLLGDDPCIWAESASPFAGGDAGFYAVPSIGDGVWIEAQQGDPDHPVWTGCWRSSATDVPPEVLTAEPGRPPVVLQSASGDRLVIGAERSECLVIETSRGKEGPRIVVTPTSITLVTGQGASIVLDGQAVRINGDALTVDAR